MTHLTSRSTKLEISYFTIFMIDPRRRKRQEIVTIRNGNVWKGKEAEVNNVSEATAWCKSMKYHIQHCGKRYGYGINCLVGIFKHKKSPKLWLLGTRWWCYKARLIQRYCTSNRWRDMTDDGRRRSRSHVNIRNPSILMGYDLIIDKSDNEDVLLKIDSSDNQN